MGKQIGIDLGTANTLAYIKGKGIVLREPSVVALDSRSGRVHAVGLEAKEMLGKTPGSIIAFRPLKDGVIAEFDVTKKMLRQFIKRIAPMNMLTRPSVIICIPYGITEVERRAVEDATLEAGAHSVALIEEPIAAAIGAGLDVAHARGSMIVDIGGGTTEVAVLSLGSIVVSNSLRTAGDEMDESIVSYVRRKYSVLIGESTAESVKKQIGTVHPEVDRGEMDVRGRNLLSGLPATVTLGAADLAEALRDNAAEILETIKSTLEETPPELSGDIYDDGIMLAGGGALIGGLDKLISESTALNVKVAAKPLDCVVDGIGCVIDDLDEYATALNFVKMR